MIHCNQQMKLSFVFDDPNKGYAFNLWCCELCGTVTKDDVWNNKGITTITLEGEIEKERKI